MSIKYYEISFNVCLWNFVSTRISNAERNPTNLIGTLVLNVIYCEYDWRESVPISPYAVY